MWQIILTAVALLLVIEGIIPFLSPRKCKQMMEAVSKVSDNALRVMGLIAMLAGVLIMFLVHAGFIG